MEEGSLGEVTVIGGSGVGMAFPYMYVCVLHACSTHRAQKRMTVFITFTVMIRRKSKKKVI